MIPEDLRRELAGLNLQAKLHYDRIYVKNAIYSMDNYSPSMINSMRGKRRSALMIRIQVDELLKERERTFYWLAKETGVSHTTLWRLKKGKAQGITFDTLEKLCQTLGCQPGDVMKLGPNKTNKKK
jgi:putative transcriptional regulator